MEGEAHCHVGLTLENRGEHSKASHHMETFHGLARKHKWFTDNGEELHKIACEHLRRMYTKIAEQVCMSAGLCFSGFNKCLHVGCVATRFMLRAPRMLSLTSRKLTKWSEKVRACFNECSQHGSLTLCVGGDGYQEGLASYRLGNAYESVGEHDAAIKVRVRMSCIL